MREAQRRLAHAVAADQGHGLRAHAEARRPVARARSRSSRGGPPPQQRLAHRVAPEVEGVHGLVGADLGRRALHDHAAVVHHRDPLGHAQRDVHVVLDQDQGDRRIERKQHLGQVHALGAGEPRRRLVEHHELGLRDAGHADLELPLLAVRQLGDHHVEAVAEPHRLGHRACLVTQARRRPCVLTRRRWPSRTPSTAR